MGCKMYALHLQLRPTAGLTFRRVPFASTQMLTYPFAPAPTLSGYLERLRRLRRGEDLPETALTNPPTIALPLAYRVLGAYPVDERYRIHRATRQGPRSLGHQSFGALRLADTRKQDESFQVYTWEYLLVDRLVGWVVHPERAALEELASLENVGCKLGKEGYAYVEEVRIEALEPVDGGRPRVAVPAEVAGMAASTVYPVYRYHRKGEVIVGYEPLRLALVDGVLRVPGYRTESGAFLPQVSIDEL